MNEVAKLPAIEVGTLAILNKSEIDQQIATAHAFPRSVKRFRDQALDLATLNEATAAECIYALPRDGKVIEGPSARLAEILVSSWGNCRAGARVVEEGMEFVTAQGVFHDLEANSVITYESKRRITNKKGMRYNADMIATTANAACSIALRNAILKGIPKALWNDIYEQARHAAVGDVKTLANKRAEAIKAFMAYGVDEARILAVLEVPSIEDIGMDELSKLRGLFTAIKDGEITPENAFPLPEKPKPAGEAPKTLEEFGKAGGKEEVKADELHDPQTGELPVADADADIPAAFERGRAARGAGMAFKAVPTEWRDDANAKFAEAWSAGWRKRDDEIVEEKKRK